MAGILSIGESGLLASQLATRITSQNTANASNPYYTRRTLEFSERNFTGFGEGVEVSTIFRMFDDFALTNLRNSVSTLSSSNSYLKEISQLETYITGAGTNINKGVEDLFASLQVSITDPSSVPARSTFLNQAKLLVNRFNSISDEVARRNDNINSQLTAETAQITALAKSLASINTKISSNPLTDSASLLDQRDKLLQQLSEHIDVSSIEEGDGTLTVFIGAGDTLVIGDRYANVTTTANNENPQLLDVHLIDGFRNVNLTASINNGSIAGLLQFRRDNLEPTYNEIGRLALAIGERFNQQNRDGLDLQGNLGTDFFTDINTLSARQNRVLPNNTNTGGGSLDINIDDSSQLTASNYRLNFTSAVDYSIERLSDNTTVAAGTFGGFPTTVSFDGVTLNVNAGGFVNGDRFLLTPTRNASREISLAISDPRRLALAAPIRTTTDSTNLGTATISSGTITDIANASFTTTAGQLTPPITIEFLSPTTYQLVNTTTSAVIEGPIVFAPGTDNPVFPTPGAFDPGYQVVVAGTPQTGDRLYINYNSNASSDNRNGLLLNSLQSQRILENNSFSFQEKFSALVNDVATSTNYAKITNESAQVIKDQAQVNRDSLSAVNLDEEAINLLIYEKMFQANAQTISTANSMLDTLLSILSTY